MSFQESGLMGKIADEQRVHIALAEKMIRKYWGSEVFHNLDGDKEILAFAKKHAQTIDKLEAIDKFFEKGYAEFCCNEGIIDSVYAEAKTILEVYNKSSALSPDSRKEALLSIDEKVLGLINCLPETYLNKYLLIVHNEGAEKAEEVRNSETGLKEYKTNYLSAYQPDPREMEKPKTFSQQLLGSLERAA